MNKSIDFNRPFVFQGSTSVSRNPDGFAIALHNTPAYSHSNTVSLASVGASLGFYENLSEGIVIEQDLICNNWQNYESVGDYERSGKHIAIQTTDTNGTTVSSVGLDNIDNQIFDPNKYDLEWNPKNNVISFKLGNFDKIEYQIPDTLATKLKLSPGYLSVSTSVNYYHKDIDGESVFEGDDPSRMQVSHFIYTDGPVQVPGEDGEQGSGDEVIVTPGEGEGELRPNPDGGVQLPEQGGTITPGGGNGNDVNVPGGSVVNPDGSVELPGGGTIKPTPDGGVELPGQDGELDAPGNVDNPVVTPGEGGNNTVNPDGSVTVPDNGGDVTFPNNPDNNGSTTIPGGSTVKPDGTVETPDGGIVRPNPDGTITVPGEDNTSGTDDDVTFKPGGNGDVVVNPDGSVTVPDGGVELPGQDGELDAPGNVDNPVVTPGEGGNTTVNPDGSVTVPDNGGNVTFPNNPDNNGSTTIPGGSTVKPDGTVETPDGGIVRPNPDGGVELPGNDGNIEAPDNVDNPVVTPGGDGNAAVNPDGSVTLPEGGDITYPNNPDYPGGSIIVPPGSAVNPDGSVTLPNGDKVDTEDNGTIILPGQDENLGTDDDVIVTPDGDATINPDGSVDLPNGGDITFPNKPEAGMEVPGGSNVGQDGTVTAPNGDQSRPNVDGTITVPGHDGQFGTDDDGIIYPTGPNKPVLNEDGTITLPDGGVITFPGLGDCEIEILPGGYVASTGVVTNPGADGIINTQDDEIIDPAVVCAVNVSVGDILTNTGVSTTIAMLVAVVGLATLALFINRNRK